MYVDKPTEMLSGMFSQFNRQISWIIFFPSKISNSLEFYFKFFQSSKKFSVNLVYPPPNLGLHRWVCSWISCKKKSGWAPKENWSLELKVDFPSWTPSRPLSTPFTSSTFTFLLPSSTPRFQDERLSTKHFWSPPDFYRMGNLRIHQGILLVIISNHPSTTFVACTLKFCSPPDFYVKTYHVKQSLL